MSNKYRVVMKDSVNGNSFTFAVYYHTANAKSAGQMAIKEWDNLPIIETQCVVGNFGCDIAGMP